MKDISIKLKEFQENEARSCSMDSGCITPEYVYRMWGGTVPLNEIEEAMRIMVSNPPYERMVNCNCSVKPVIAG